MSEEEKIVATPCTHLYLRPLPGTRFALYLAPNGKTRVRLEYQKGREKELAAHFMQYIDQHLMRFVPLPEPEHTAEFVDDEKNGDETEGTL